MHATPDRGLQSCVPSKQFQNRRGLSPFCVVFGEKWGLSPSPRGFETASRQIGSIDPPVREVIVRSVICLLIVLSGLAYYSTKIDLELPMVAPRRVAESPWRRTKDGWQRSDRWPGAASSNQPMQLLGGFAISPASLPHPLIVALLLLLPSLLLLVAFSARTTPPIAPVARRRRWWPHGADAGGLAEDRSPVRDPNNR